MVWLAVCGSLFEYFKNGHPGKNKRGRNRTALKWLLSSLSRLRQTQNNLPTLTGFPRNRLFLPSWLHFNATVLFSKAGRSFFAFRNCKLFSEYLLALYFSSHYLHQNLPSGKFIAMSDEFKQEPKCLLWPCFNIHKSGVVLLLQMRVGISITPSDNVSTQCFCSCYFSH